MFVYKKLKGSDTSLVPFNTHKQFSFVWGGQNDDPDESNILMGVNSGSGCRIYTASYASHIPLEEWTAGNILHSQLQHLYYGNYPFNVAETFGDVNILNQNRYLDEKAVVISIPQQYYGSQIKPGSFSYSRHESTGDVDDFSIDVNNRTMCFDDGKGNLLEFSTLADALYQDGIKSTSVMQEDKGISLIDNKNPYSSKFLIEENHPDASVNLSRLMDPKNRLLSIKPKHAYKKAKQNYHLDEYGKPLVNLPYNSGLTPEDGTYDYFSLGYEGWNELHNKMTKGAGKGDFPRLYSEEFIYDDSHYRNLLTYKNILFTRDVIEDNTGDGSNTHNYNGSVCNGKFNATTMGFVANHNNNCTGSQIMSPHNEKFNFNLEDDFSITFHIKMPDYSGDPDAEGPFGKQYIIGKSTTKTTVGPPQETSAGGIINLSATGSSSEITASASPQFPFEIWVEGDYEFDGGGKEGGSIDTNYKFVFAMSDGINTVTASCAPRLYWHNEWQHVTAVYEGVHSGSEGRLSITTTGKSGMGHLLETASYTNGKKYGLPILKNPLQNNANIYIGCKGGSSQQNENGESGSFFEGHLYGINIWDYALHPSESKAIAHMFTYDTTKYVGNIFYNQGIAVITNPQYFKSGQRGGSHNQNYCRSFEHTGSATSSVIFQGTHVIYENEYQCTVQENEMNYSTNITTRKIQSEDGQEIADFTTSSIFQPYVSTIGLYDENNELLVVGKLGQPIKTSQETDTTFVLRWDT
tara:strand:- start:9 stop:2252 length:2244 start_codon:yes stop_codon:yes gene_type:complete